jgi:protein TonB
MARRAIASFLVLVIAAGFAGDRSAPVRPLDPLTAIFSDRDYPKSARKAREQGTVAFRLEISRAGRIASCIVTASSGSATLDAATCRILRARGRFEPARDDRGRTIPDSVIGKIIWRLPLF